VGAVVVAPTNPRDSLMQFAASIRSDRRISNVNSRHSSDSTLLICVDIARIGVRMIASELSLYHHFWPVTAL
jgi:hypothetical protein